MQLCLEKRWILLYAMQPPDTLHFKRTFEEKQWDTFCMEDVSQIVERPPLPYSVFVLPETDLLSD